MSPPSSASKNKLRNRREWKQVANRLCLVITSLNIFHIFREKFTYLSPYLIIRVIELSPVNILQNTPSFLCYRLNSLILKKRKRAYAISMLSAYPSSHHLNTWINIYVSLFVYHGNWTRPNGVLYKFLPSVCVWILLPIVARQQLDKRVPAVSKYFWMRRFLCAPWCVKWKKAISSYRISCYYNVVTLLFH
jgi:hypothetical protein